MVGDRGVPAADEQRRDTIDHRVLPRLDPAADAAQVGIGRPLVMLRGEQQRHVDRDTRGDALLDRGSPLLGTRDLDEQVVHPGPVVQRRGLGHRAGRVVREPGRHL